MLDGQAGMLAAVWQNLSSQPGRSACAQASVACRQAGFSKGAELCVRLAVLQAGCKVLW